MLNCKLKLNQGTVHTNSYICGKSNIIYKSFQTNAPFTFSFSLALHKFAVMGVNTALIQAAIMARAKTHIILPGKVAARADILKGNYKVEALPIEAPEHLADLK